jgi:hypothetical protein
MIFDSTEKLGHLCILKRGNFRFGTFGQDSEAGGICFNVANAKSLLERAVENAMDVLDRLGIKRFPFILVVLQAIDELLDMYRR